MTAPPTSSDSPEDQRPTQPVYVQSELYDSPADLKSWPLLAPLLKTWHTEVWEKDHNESRGCWYYDQEAIRLQERHKLVVIVGAVTGTAAVVLAILQLRKEEAAASLLNLEVACLIAAVIAVVLGAVHRLDHRWREDRFKAEQYRMLKFRFLHDATRWLAASESERAQHLTHYISRIHAANRDGIKEWIHWKKEILPLLESPDTKLDPLLVAELTDYFRQRRLIPQQHYFHSRGHQLHGVESIVRWIGPGLFFASVICALTHAVIHVLHPKSHVSEDAQKLHSEPKKEIVKDAGKDLGDLSSDSESPAAKDGLSWAVILALGAAIFPVTAAGIRTWRGAFEFGRNSLRFESMAHHLELLLDELGKAKSPEAQLAILRRGEHAMESEHRAWMRLMMEAEWFG